MSLRSKQEFGKASGSGKKSSEASTTKSSSPAPQQDNADTFELDAAASLTSGLSKIGPAKKGKKKGAPVSRLASKAAAVPANFEEMMTESNKVVRNVSSEISALEAESKENVEAGFKFTEAPKKVRKAPPAVKTTITFRPDDALLAHRHTFPLYNFKTVISCRPNDENILDFTGFAQITDAVLSCFRDLPFNVRDSVIGVRLTGCHLVTDIGVEFLTETFHNVKKLILSGCMRVTEASMMVVAEKLTSLETLDISGTSVSVLPRQLIDLTLVKECTLIASPLTSEMKSLPSPAVDMCKVCFIRRQDHNTLSAALMLQGEKDIATSLPLMFKPNFACGKDSVLNLIECTELTVDMFCHGWGVYVIVSELTDKTQINAEAKRIFSIMMSILMKMGNGNFVILGMHTSKAGIVPMDVIRENIQSQMQMVLGQPEMRQTMTADPQNLGEQLVLDQAERLKVRLNNLSLTTLEVNVDERDKAVTKLKEHLAAQVTNNPESKLYCKGLADFMHGFPDQGGKDLKVGIHTLSGAASILLQGFVFDSLLEAQGAIKYLVKMGKLCKYRQASGREVYLSPSFLCQLLRSMLETPPRTPNNTKDIAVNSQTLVMTSEELAERASKAKVTVDLLRQVLKELGTVGVPGVMTPIFIPFHCLLDQPDVSLDRFDKTANNIQASYMFPLPVPIPGHVWHQVQSRLTALHWPLHMWRHGLIIQHGIVDMLITCEGDKISFLAQTIHVDKRPEDSEKCVKMLWQCLEQYKLLVDQVFVLSGFIPQVTCSADKPKPDGIVGMLGGHSLHSQTKECQTCGDTAPILTMLKIADADVRPKMLSEENVMFSLTADDVKQGSLHGSNITLQPGGKVYISSGRTETDEMQMFTFIFNSSNYEGLQFILSSFNKQVAMKFSGQETLCLIPLDSKKEISKLVPGVVVNVSLQATDDKTMECLVDCHGHILSRELLPTDQYRLDIQLSSSKEVSNVQFTVISQHFGFRGSMELKKGMRLEALDRQNPHLICVATIEDIKPERRLKGGPLLIHFDGWTSRYDYWAEEDSTDLHPIGYMAQIGHSKGVNELQAPNGYRKAFHWLTYLREVKAEPVPFGFFNSAQLNGTKPDHTLSICKELGIGMSSDVGYESLCYSLPYRHSALEYHVKEMNREKPEKLSSFFKTNPRVFCLLPTDLDIKFLRYPSLSTLFQPSKQSLHMLCAGQENTHHLVDHEGLKSSEVVNSYDGHEDFLQCVYSALLHTGALTVPLNMKHLCKGVADKIPLDQQPRLEHGFRRLYRLYLMIFRFFEMLADSHDQTNIHKRTYTLEGQAQIRLKTLLESQAKTTQFSQAFSHSTDLTKFLCKGHEAAQSGDKGLTAFPTEVFDLGKTGTLSMLYLFRNQLESLPDDMSSRLPTLSQLMVSENRLTAVPSLSGFTGLTHLSLHKNQIKSLELTDNLSTTLVSLIINENPLNGLPPSISKLSSLNALMADNVGVVKSLEPISSLNKLERLSLNSSVVASLPQKFSALPLTSLYLASIPLAKPRSSSGMEPVTMESLMKTYEKYSAVSLLSKEERATLFLLTPGKPEEENIAAVNKRMLERFPRLGGAAFPAQLLQMTTLVKLDLSYQGFITVPDDIKNLTNLKGLILNGCFRLETLSAELSTLKLETLSLIGCMSLKTPPREIVDRGFQAVFGYLRRLQMGSVDCKRTKLMMVGLGGAGKTSLVRALRTSRFHQNYDYDEMITDGIDICKWDVPIKGEKLPLQFSVWDFAGQTVYYNTHQFFLSNRAVYMLLWNIRLGYEHAGLDFWLSSIACHAPKAPVLVVGTHFDKVNKSYIPEVELKRRFPQIHSFHFVSSYTGDGIAKLTEDLKAVTLTQKYMGEKIPEVWLNLEKQLASVRDAGKALLPWKEVEEAGHRSGIFDNIELTQAIQFLHDLGSVQFFNTEFLRSNVVIVPQWIVDVMACVVTVHEGPIKNGMLNHEDMEEVWHAYPKELHSWLLRLTEEFDLTFSLPDRRANIIPCLLPETEPTYNWTPVKRDSGQREMKMIYKFGYLPTGLFNRAQVRLQEFSDNAVLWKKGSMLKKNGHIALVLHTGNIEVVVKAQGFKPENMLFLVHEVFECLISESYSGVHYDYFIPCVECQNTSQSEVCMFARSKVQRAVEFKAPFLQCDSFHIMSIPEIQAIMPPDHDSDFDDHLRRGVHELYSLEEDVVISIFVCYSRKNVPDLAQEGKIVHPGTVLDDLRGAGYKVSFTDDPENANMEALTLSMKAAQVVIIGISDDFLANKQCYSLIFYARETLKKPILLMTLGKTSDWQKQDINFLLGNEVYVKMQDIARYDPKIKELISAVKTKAGVKAVETFPDVFISYCWKNSQTAVKLGTVSDPSALGWGDPRTLKEFLHKNEISCWLDVEQMGQEGFYEDLARGVRTSKVMVACVSDEYALSKTCRMEFQFAVASVRIPVIVAVMGTGFQWESSEIGMLAVGHNCFKVNLQLENEAGLQEVLKKVRDVLGKAAPASSSAAPATPSSQRKMAFQEALELTQRKMLRQLVMYRSSSGQEDFPHLVCIDLVDSNSKGEGQEQNSNSGVEKEKADGEKKDDEVPGMPEESPAEEAQSDLYCFRVLCEWEQGWHSVSETIPFPKEVEDNGSFLKDVAPFCVRMMAVLKHTSLSLPVLTQPQGEQLYKNFEEWTSRSNTEFEAAYKCLLEMVRKQDKQKNYGGLKRCHVTNGKQLWLCPEHSAQMGNVSADTGMAIKSVPYTDPNAEGQDDDDDDASGDSFEYDVEVPEEPKLGGGGVSAAAVPDPVPPQTPNKRPGSIQKRASSRACLLM